jgi:uncharacterized damage-inducible protein DinB
MEEQLAETWRLNQQKNIVVIDNTTDNGMQQSLSNRGRTVYQQWVHIHNVRVQWLDTCSKGMTNKYAAIDKTEPCDRKLLIKNLEESARAIEELLLRAWSDNGKLKSFKKGVLPFLGYLIAHESHHRGNILLTLKQTGEKIPDSVKWALWEWA